MKESQVPQESADSDDSMKLGGNIELSGFRSLDGGSMIILKKIVGSYARKFSQICRNFESLRLRMKPVHKTEASKKYELHGSVIDNGKQFNSELTDRNLFVVADAVLQKIEHMLKK